ncbi:hypothetical protein ABBQ38_003067 [Trebouxia sp. C0009 RCD-2024]
MFVDAGGIVDRIEAYDLADGETWITRDEIAKKLDISRVVFLFVVVIDFVGLALAMIMRGMSDHPYSNAFEDPELGFSNQHQNEATPLSHPSPYDSRHKTAALELQDRPQKGRSDSIPARKASTNTGAASAQRAGMNVHVLRTDVEDFTDHRTYHG